MVLETYVGPPPHEVAKEFVNMWRVLREAIEDGLKMPNLTDETETRFLLIKAEIVKKSRILQIITEGKWGIHDKAKGLLNVCQSLEYIRQETQIMHDSIRNQWHDNYIQASKSVAVFEKEFMEE